MSGFFGVASKKDCVLDLFFGVDYHSLPEDPKSVPFFYDLHFGKAQHEVFSSIEIDR